MKRLIILLIASLFGCAAFSQGFYMEMKMGTTDNADMGVMKVYSQDGNSRSEINLNTPGGPMDMLTLILKGTPNTLYVLNTKGKTYSEMDISQNNQYKDFPKEDYEVTVLGKEKVNGYNATHVKIMHKGSSVIEEMWTSKDVADYSALINAKTKFTGRLNLNKALAEKGADGFPVRIKTAERGMNVQVDLVKAEKRNFLASLFSLDGYAKSSAPSMGGGMSQQEMLQKIQNMTPEERQQYIEQLKNQYGQPH
jgi:Domain of unknown function (DUF4412)